MRATKNQLVLTEVLPVKWLHIQYVVSSQIGKKKVMDVNLFSKIAKKSLTSVKSYTEIQAKIT